MSRKRSTRPRKLDDRSIDDGLDRLLAETPPGQTRSLQEIAAACGCSRQNISYIERQAIKKLRAALESRGIGPDTLTD